MEIEIRLKQVLKEHKLDKHGVTKKIASDCGVHRHTIGKLYRNQLSHPSLEVLGKVCKWLMAHDVPGDELPQALFGARPSELWQAITAPGSVTIYLGEYQQVAEPMPARRWVALRDAAVASNITHYLTTGAYASIGPVTVRTEYVPFRFSTRAPRLSERVLQEDIEQAKATFDQMRIRGKSETAILIGSQRVNYLVEYLVAGLFGCDPFVPQNGRVLVPFYQGYRDFDRTVPSCFGGDRNPPGRHGRITPGTYYLDETGQWNLLEWEALLKDAGLVITIYDPGTKALELALFGLSGRSTAALGQQLTDHANRFWPPNVQTTGGKKVGVFVCRLEFVPDDNGANDAPEIADMKVIQLSEDVLEQYLR